MDARLYCDYYKPINQALGIVLEGWFQLQKPAASRYASKGGLLGRIPAGDSMEHLVHPERKEESWWLAGNTTLPPAACDVKSSHAY